MKNKVLDALKQKFSNLGMSDQILSSVAEMVVNSIQEESEIEGAITKYEPLLKVMQSESDKLRTAAAKKKQEQIQTQKQEQTEDHHGAGNPPEPNKNHNIDNPDQMPEWAKDLVSAVSTLTNKIQTIEGEKISTQRKSVIDNIIKDLPQSLKSAYLRTDYAKLSDEDFNALTADITKEMENINKEIGIKGGLFKTPFDGTKQQRQEQGKSDKEIESIVDKIKI